MKTNISNTLTYSGMALIFLIGAIHLLAAPAEFGNSPVLTYLFLLNFVCTLVAAFGISRHVFSWGWGFGMILAFASFAGFVMSRMGGLPGMNIEPWFDPATGIPSLFLELAYAFVFFKALPHLARHEVA